MPVVITKAAAAVLTAVGAPAGFVSVAAPIIGNAVWTAGVTAGLGALARAQVPDAQSAQTTVRMSRPPRRICMGLASRAAGAYLGAVQ